MINIQLFNSVAFIYLFSSFLYFCYLFFRKEKIGKAATAVTLVGFFVQTIAYVVRWVESYQLGMGQSPLHIFTQYQILVFTCWSMTTVYLVVEYKYHMRVLGAIILPLISLGMLYASLSPTMGGEIKELPSVLQGNFFIYHGVSFVIGFAAFGISCLVSSFVLMMENPKWVKPQLKEFLERLPSPKILDDLSYKSIAIGFILISIGIGTSLYITKLVWGTYWNWDPIQTCTFITWLLYALILHGRYQKWWRHKASSFLSIIAFVTAIICFLVAGSYLMMSGHYPVLSKL